jgi:hypothetical protein
MFSDYIDIKNNFLKNKKYIILIYFKIKITLENNRYNIIFILNFFKFKPRNQHLSYFILNLFKYPRVYSWL